MDDKRIYIPSDAEKARAMALADERARIVDYRDATFEKYDDNWWHAVQTIQFGDEPLGSLSIQTQGTQPEERHYLLLDNVWNKNEEINSSIEKEAFHYYKSIRDLEYRKMSEDLDPSTARIILPEIHSEDEIWRVCSYSTIDLPIQTDDILTFQISLICNWDDQNGLLIKFREGRILEIGVGTW